MTEERIVRARTEEQQRLKKLREAFRLAFPNPERKGCPGRELMRGMVAGRIAPDEEQRWIDHFCFCSPCYALVPAPDIPFAPGLGTPAETLRAAFLSAAVLQFLPARFSLRSLRMTFWPVWSHVVSAHGSSGLRLFPISSRTLSRPRA